MLVKQESPDIWGSWAKGGGHALGELAEMVKERILTENSQLEEIYGWLDFLEWDMPEEIWKIIVETKTSTILSVVLLADTVVTKSTRCFFHTERAKVEMPEEALFKLLRWFGVGKNGEKTISKTMAQNRIFIIRALLRDHQ